MRFFIALLTLVAITLASPIPQAEVADPSEYSINLPKASFSSFTTAVAPDACGGRGGISCDSIPPIPSNNPKP
jgi:hypothetical protein